MTASTHYGDLLKRQAELQTLGNMPPATLEQVRLALRVELGELAQECKTDWAWWKRPGTAPQDPARILQEAADCLHFMLLLDLAHDEDDALTCPDWGELSAFSRNTSVTDLLNILFERVSDPEHTDMPGWEMTDVLCALLRRYGFTPADLARAYWEKSEENLRRWREAREGQA